MRTCVNSILEQTYGNLEILLINDGSTDGSGELCDEFASQDSRVRVIHKRNMGVSAARNDGIESATGEYIAFVDSDDVIAHRMMEKLYQLANSTGADIAVCGYKRVPNQVQNLAIEETGKSGTFSREEALRDFISTHGYGGFLWNKLFRTELFCKPEKLRLNTDIFICEDLLMTSLLTERANLIAFTEDKLYAYVIRENSASKRISDKTLTAVNAKKQMISIYERNGLPDGGSQYVSFVANLLTYGYEKTVRTHFDELCRELRNYRSLFLPRLHSRKENIIFRTMVLSPRLFAGIYGTLRRIRRRK